MAYRVRFYMEMNAREAMHVIELRTAPQGHPAYRRICQTMHRLIAEGAGHRGLAAAMTFVDHSAVALERLEAERAAEQRRGGPRVSQRGACPVFRGAPRLRRGAPSVGGFGGPAARPPMTKDAGASASGRRADRRARPA